MMKIFQRTLGAVVTMVVLSSAALAVGQEPLSETPAESAFDDARDRFNDELDDYSNYWADYYRWRNDEYDPYYKSESRFRNRFHRSPGYLADENPAKLGPEDEADERFTIRQELNRDLGERQRRDYRYRRDNSTGYATPSTRGQFRGEAANGYKDYWGPLDGPPRSRVMPWR